MAHPDDAEIWCGGTLARYARSSDVFILVGTENKERAQEAAMGAEVMGARVDVVPTLSVESCKRAISDYRPSIVITHRIDDMHTDHRRTADLVMSSVIDTRIELGKPARLYTCDTYNSLTLSGAVEGSVILDISDTFDQKLRAISKHQSQPTAHFTRMAQRQAAIWGARIGRDWGEAFDPIPILGIVPAAEFL